MEENNNRNGQGTFLAIMGVATLVITIIGATFAFFSASATNNSTIKGNTSAASNLTLTVTQIDGATGGLIPMADSLSDEALDQDCVDDNGSTVCHVYQIKLKNGPSKVQINGTLSFTMASGVSSIVYNIAAVDQTSVKTLANLADVSTINTGTGALTSGTLASSTTFDANAEKYYYVVVWLHETGEAQDTEAGKTNAYVGTVTFNAVGDNGIDGVTAKFS